MFDSSTSCLVEINFSLMENAHSEGSMNTTSGQMMDLADAWQFLSTKPDIHISKAPLIFLLLNYV